MHRYVWIKERGKIPEKYHVHHIDGDKSNNKIENLTLMHISDHTRLHSLEYISKNREKFINHLNNIRPLASLAQKSDIERKRKRERVALSFLENKKVKSKCETCGCEIEYTIGFKKKVFCGKKCAASTQSRKDKKNKNERERYRLLHESIK